MSKWNYALFFLSVTYFISCNTNEAEPTGTVDPNDIFFDYKIWGEEGKDEVTCLLQFRYRRETGKTVKLDSPSWVSFDGEIIFPDSVRITGPFYEIRRPINDFIGTHRITLTDINKKEYTEEFNFQPFTLLSEIIDTIARDDWTFDIDGLKPDDQLRVIAIDTSFDSDDINEFESVKNGKLIIRKEKLRTLVNGPVTLLLNHEEERAIRNGTQRGGKITITYGLKRELLLTGAF